MFFQPFNSEEFSKKKKGNIIFVDNSHVFIKYKEHFWRNERINTRDINILHCNTKR